MTTKRATILAITILSLVTGVTKQSANASVRLSLSSPSDLSSLVVGDIVTIEVNLSEVGIHEAVAFLEVHISFDEHTFRTPMPIAPGPIVTDPSQFSVVTSPGNLVAVFDDEGLYGTPKIRRNGVFFSFELEAIGVGSGAIKNPLVDARLASNPILLKHTSRPLPYTVSPTVAVVPEPTTLAIWGLLGLFVQGLRVSPVFTRML